MKIPSNSLCCRTLFLQAADEGRGPVLFGENWERSREAVIPFVEGVPFPDVYLEFPLAGEPFLDTTVLLKKIPAGTRFSSPAAAGTEAILDWYAKARAENDGISFGYELDGDNPGPGAIHFQSYSQYRLAGEFCEAAGEPEVGRLYQDLAGRMPEGWPLAFLGMFRGRPGSPLRVCGYVDGDEKKRCAEDPSRMEAVFRQLGFTAYDAPMIRQLTAVLAAAPEAVDFQLDVYPDGRLGDTFSVDAGFRTMRQQDALDSFDSGAYAKIMGMLEEWGAADSRWKLAAGMCFSRGIPVVDEEGADRLLALVISPNWTKARWRGGALQPSKLYCLVHAELLDPEKKK